MSAGALFFPPRATRSGALGMYSLQSAGLGVQLWGAQSLTLAVTKDAGGPNNGKNLQSIRVTAQSATPPPIPSAQRSTLLLPSRISFYYSPPPASPQVSHCEDIQGVYQNRLLLKIHPVFISQKRVRRSLVNVASFTGPRDLQAQVQHQGRFQKACCRGICESPIFRPQTWSALQAFLISTPKASQYSPPHKR